MTTSDAQNGRWLLIAVGLLLSGCGEKNEPAAAVPRKPEQSLGAYADSLVKKTHSELSGYGPTQQTLASPLSYLTVFTATNPTSVNSTLAVGDEQSTFETNLRTTDQWQAIYCTDELRALMSQHQIAVASAQLVDTDGKMRSLSMCIATTDKLPPPRGDTGAASEGGFSSIQICRAALSVMYNRDVASMKGGLSGGFAQVKYRRDSDKREFSYRCKLSGGFVHTWDDLLSGARWYGAEASDSQLRYSSSGSKLLVQDVLQGRVNRERLFSSSDLGD